MIMKKEKFFNFLLFFLFLYIFSFATVEEFEKAVQLDKNSVIKRYNLGYAYYSEGMYDKAIDTLKKTLEINKDDKSSHGKVDFKVCQMLGIIYFNEKGDDDSAIKYFKKAIKINPSDPENYYYIGLSYLRKGEIDSALKNFKTSIIKGIKNKVDVNFRIAQIYYKKGNYSKAIEYLKKVIKKNPKHVEALELLGIIYHKRNIPELAIKYLKKVVKIKRDNFNAFYLLGLNYFKQKKYDKMINAYKRAIALKPDFADAHYNLGMAYYYRNMYEDAIKELEIAKKLNPSDAATFSLLAQAKTSAYEYHLSKGTTYFTDEDFINAKKEFELALKVKKDDAIAKRYLEKTKEAIKKEIPKLLEKAEKYYKNKNYAGAYAEWKKVLDMEPSNSKAKDGLKKLEKNLTKLIKAREKQAMSYYKQGKFKQALNEYYEIKKIVPKVKRKIINEKIKMVKNKLNLKINSLLKRARVYFTKKQYKKALESYNEVLKYDENNEKALSGITSINSKISEDKEKYLAKGKKYLDSDKEKALMYFKKVVNLDPNNKEANKYIEQLTGKKSQKLINAEKVRELYYNGVDKYVNGDIEGAIKVWEKVLKIDPNHIEAKKNIKKAREKLAAIKRLSK